MTVSDLDQLFRSAVQAAASVLAADRPLWPFALGLTLDGEVVAPTVDPGQARPSAERVVALLHDALARSRDGLRAAVVVTDVIAGGAPALRLELEERDGEAVAVTVPYLPGPDLQEPTRAPGVRRTWP